MQSNKQRKALYIAAGAAVLAWPFGELVGLVLAVGQDGPGSVLAQSFSAVVTAVVWGISTIVVIWKLCKASKGLSRVARATAAISVIFLPVVAIVSVANYQAYDIEARNQTGTRIVDVSVSMTGKRHSFGILVVGATKMKAFQQGRPAGIAEIRWTGENRQSYLVEIDLAGVVPRRFNRGILTFTIAAEDDVKVGFFIPPETYF